MKIKPLVQSVRTERQYTIDLEVKTHIILFYMVLHSEIFGTGIKYDKSFIT